MDLQTVRRRLYRLHAESGLDHLGSALSCLEIMYCLHFQLMKSGEDEFILSKGHAVSALYSCLAELGRMSEEDFAGAMKAGGLSAHVPSARRDLGIIYGTGSLGHGLSVACGLALGKKIQNRPGRVYALLSDGECNEGSTWEAAMFAHHHGLDNLTAIIDRNGWQCMGATEDVLKLEPFAEKWRAFGFECVEIPNGHDLEALQGALALSSEGRPSCVIARTVKANGLPQYYDNVESHYFKFTKEDYALRGELEE